MLSGVGGASGATAPPLVGVAPSSGRGSVWGHLVWVAAWSSGTVTQSPVPQVRGIKERSLLIGLSVKGHFS